MLKSRIAAAMSRQRDSTASSSAPASVRSPPATSSSSAAINASSNNANRSSGGALRAIANPNDRLLTPDQVLQEVDELHSALMDKLTRGQELNSRAFRRLHKEREFAFEQLNALENAQREAWVLWAQLLDSRVRVAQKEERQWVRLQAFAAAEKLSLQQPRQTASATAAVEEPARANDSHAAVAASSAPRVAIERVDAAVSAIAPPVVSVQVQTDPVEFVDVAAKAAASAAASAVLKRGRDASTSPVVSAASSSRSSSSSRSDKDADARVSEALRNQAQEFHQSERQLRRDSERRLHERERELLFDSALLRLQLHESEKRRSMEGSAQAHRFDVSVLFAEDYSRVWEHFGSKISSEMLKLDVLLQQQQQQPPRR